MYFGDTCEDKIIPSSSFSLLLFLFVIGLVAAGIALLYQRDKKITYCRLDQGFVGDRNLIRLREEQTSFHLKMSSSNLYIRQSSRRIEPISSTKWQRG